MSPPLMALCTDTCTLLRYSFSSPLSCIRPFNCSQYGWASSMHGCPPSALACPNVTFAEFGSVGPGALTSHRVRWSSQLNETAAARFTRASVLGDWVPATHPGGEQVDSNPHHAMATKAVRVGDGWGTNIHWTRPPGGEAEAAMLARAFRVARMDFKWSAIEKAKGVYDFSAYDSLLGTMQTQGVRPYWILDYGNPLYPPGPTGNCSTPSGCNASCPAINNQSMRMCDDGELMPPFL